MFRKLQFKFLGTLCATVGDALIEDESVASIDLTTRWAFLISLVPGTRVLVSWRLYMHPLYLLTTVQSRIQFDPIATYYIIPYGNVFLHYMRVFGALVILVKKRDVVDLSVVDGPTRSYINRAVLFALSVIVNWPLLYHGPN